MEPTSKNLSICEDCGKEPAIYGDGLTWARGAACEQKRRSSGTETPQGQPQVPSGESFPHEIKENLVSIILPVHMNSYSLFHYTGNCIGSIREHTNHGVYEEYELVVIDNGSPIKPPALSSYYADRVIVNETNLGVTKAWNQGIRMSVGKYIVLLNNDVQVFDNWLEGLRENLEEFDLVMAHPMYSLTEPFARAIEAKKIKEKVISSPNLFSTFKDFSCVMFKRSLLDEVGMFDERFFNYASDSDLFKRMEEKGKKWACVDYVPTHHISDATGFSIPETPEIMNEDKRKFAEKWESKPVAEVKIVRDQELLRIIDGGDPIYLKVGNMLHHIADAETLHALGYDFGQERTVKKEEVEKFEKGKRLNMTNYTIIYA